MLRLRPGAKTFSDAVYPQDERLRSWIFRALLIGGPLLLVLLYARYLFLGLVHPDAMDMAQLGRNLISGVGFKTYVLRPLALEGANPLRQPDPVHGPLYPLSLALAFGVLGARDGVVAGVSAFFYIATVPVVYRLGTRLFNRMVGGVSAFFFAVSASSLQHALSGRHVTLAVFLFTCLALALYEILDRWREGGASPEDPQKPPLFLAGVLTGFLYLTDPMYFWVLLVVAALVFRLSPSKKAAAVRFGIPLAVLVLPWMARNVAVSGYPVSGYGWFELWMNTDYYPGLRGYRMYAGDFVPGMFILFAVVKKVFVNAGRAIQELPGVGAVWLLAFFLPSLFFGFRDPAAGVVRRAVVSGFLALFAAMAVFTVEVSLFTALLPVFLIFAVSYFLHLLQQAKLPPSYQWTVGGLLAVTAALPLFDTSHLAEQRYLRNEALIAGRLTRLTRRNEVILTDKPWMVAWYADRPALWAPAMETRIKDLRGRFKTLRWLFLTRDVRNEGVQWHMVFDAFQQWNLMAMYARSGRRPPPAPIRIGGNMPLLNALEGFVTLDVGVSYLTPAVIGYVPETPPQNPAR